MSGKPLISGIVIFFNAERFLEQAIESVFAQTLGDWELLLVDDGSTDSGSGIARGYARRHPDRVRYLEHDGHRNLGMSASRNLGIRHARGEYIGFLDADDVWVPEKLEQQAAILQAWPEAAMVYGRTLIWQGWTGDPADAARDHVMDLGVIPGTTVEPPAILLLLLENKVQTPTTCNALVRRSVFEELGGFNEAFRGMFEDQTFFAKLCLKKKVFVSDRCWAKYRQHSESACAVAESEGEVGRTRLRFLEWVEGYLSEEGVTDPAVWRTLRADRLYYRHPFLSRLAYGARTIGWRIHNGARSRVKGLLGR